MNTEQKQDLLSRINNGDHDLTLMYCAPLLQDVYKVGHIHQYPANTELVYSNMTPRADKHLLDRVNRRVYDGKTVFFGLQAFIIEVLIDHWNRTFFHRPWAEVGAFYKRYVDAVLNTDFPIDHLEALHTLGYLPVEIRALAEGTLVPFKVPVYTIHNTNPKFGWITNALETIMSSETWKAPTVATLAYNFRATLEHWNEKTGGTRELIQWQCHDFSFRGLSGYHDAAACGVGHLTSFSGTDTLPALPRAEFLYGADVTREIVGGSVNATEHSVMCIDGSDGELDTYKRLLQQYPNGILSIVSDSYDLWQVVNEWAPGPLRELIMARQGKLVFRPDSGDPADILCGTARGVADLTDDSLLFAYGQAIEAKTVIREPQGTDMFVVQHVQDGMYYAITVDHDHPDPDSTQQVVTFTTEVLDDADVDPEMRGVVDVLGYHFGTTENAKGFKSLDSHVGAIYGDSINPRLYDEILSRLADKGYCSDVIVVGVGSYSYQYLTRDTLGSAVKATFGVVDGVGRGILKDPKTGDGHKKSAFGILSVVDMAGSGQAEELALSDGEVDIPAEAIYEGNFCTGLLVPVFRNGKLLKFQTLSEIRQRLHAWDDRFQTL